MFLDSDGGDRVTSTCVFSCEAFRIVFSLKLHLSLKNALPLYGERSRQQASLSVNYLSRYQADSCHRSPGQQETTGNRDPNCCLLHFGWANGGVDLSLSLCLSRLQSKSANATLAIISPQQPHRRSVRASYQTLFQVSQICMLQCH